MEWRVAKAHDLLVRPHAGEQTGDGVLIHSRFHQIITGFRVVAGWIDPVNSPSSVSIDVKAPTRIFEN